ncbi:MAG TPA: hypothetical protein VJ123_10065 [Anaerolineales bacterium]|nr:hypothetical protein [Anaerolineales bacterium]
MKARYALLLALIVYWLLTFVMLGTSLLKNNGHLGYPLDDTYIHMAIGKHFANDGFWGISQTGFSSSTSSPLWTFLIAITYKSLGMSDWTPFVLSLLSGSFLVLSCYYWLRRIANPLRLTAFLVLIVLLAPLPVLTLTGMEHVLHSLLTIWLTYCAATYSTRATRSSGQFTLLLLLAGLLTITRYEGLFLVFSIVLLFSIKRRFWAAFLIGGAGVLPITVYGVYSMAQGWYFLPNSVLLKGNAPVLTWEGMAGFLKHLLINLVVAPHVLVLIIACLAIFLWSEKQRTSGEKERSLIAIFLPMALLHMLFADIGWFYRYESYLVLAGSVILVETLGSVIADRLAEVGETLDRIIVITLGILFITPLAWRAGKAIKEYPIAVTNIYEQQYQMGIFLQKYYSGKTVAANDMGAINYLANIETLDLYGIGNVEVARARRNSLYSREMISDLVSMNNVEIVVIYDDWFEGNIPPEWIRIGKWQIANNVVCGSDTVSFYVPAMSLQAEAIANLRSFSDLLPSTVRQSGAYTQ